MMKRIIYAMLILCAGLVSCGKPEVPEASQEVQTLDITFAASGEYELSRGYFDAGTLPETWEKELRSVEIFVCQNNRICLRRSLTTGELNAKRVTLAIPTMSESDWELYPVRLYCIANYHAPAHVKTTVDLEALIDDQPIMYNSAGDAACPGPKWESGFTMTAKHDLKGRMPEDLQVGVTLTRTVSKIAVRVSVDPDFSANHQGGTLEITGASVIRAASDGRIYKTESGETPSAMDFTHRVGAVGSEKDKEFVFYLFPNAKQTGSFPGILVEGVFDRDGDPATTGDLFEVRYETLINENSSGVIARNQVYKYDLNVVGLNGAQMESTYSVADWVTISQDVEAGH